MLTGEKMIERKQFETLPPEAQLYWMSDPLDLT